MNTDWKKLWEGIFGMNYFLKDLTVKKLKVAGKWNYMIWLSAMRNTWKLK